MKVYRIKFKTELQWLSKQKLVVVQHVFCDFSKQFQLKSCEFYSDIYMISSYFYKENRTSTL